MTVQEATMLYRLEKEQSFLRHSEIAKPLIIPNCRKPRRSLGDGAWLTHIEPSEAAQ